MIQTTSEFGFPDQEVDIGCIATDDIERKTFSEAGEMRLYFGCKHSGTWRVALSSQPSMLEALRTTPAIQHDLYNRLPKTRWNYGALGDLMLGAVTEAYATAGENCTGAELLYEIKQNITEFAISGTTKTVKKLDGSTTAGTYTLNDGTYPTSITRAT